MSAPEPAVSRLPSPLTLAMAVIGGLLVAVALVHNLTDADYFWHFATGRLIVDGGAIPQTDPYSFTWGGAWVAHEWLGEVLIYLLVSALGGTITLILFGLMAGLSVWISARLAARFGVRTLPLVLAAAVAALILIPFVTVRPQVFSWLLLAGLVAMLARLDAARPRRALWLGPLFLAWANLHGLWVVGVFAVAVYTIATLLGRTPMSGSRRWMLLGLGAALAGPVLTPAGPAGLLYPLRYVEPGDWGLANIAEWQSPDFHDPAHLGLLVLVVALAGLGVARRVPGWAAALGLVGLAMSLVSVRNEPIAAIWCLPLLAAGLEGRLPRRERTPSPHVARQRRYLEIGFAAVSLAAVGIILLPRVQGSDAAVRAAGLPVAAVAYLEDVAPASRVFAEYGWAGYVIERLADDGARVFIDGRNDMYPDAILDAYTTTRRAGDRWEERLDDYAVDAILLPPAAPLIAAARETGGWCPAVEEPGQVLLLRCPSGD